VYNYVNGCTHAREKSMINFACVKHDMTLAMTYKSKCCFIPPKLHLLKGLKTEAENENYHLP
jgi:hypothetical protein